MGVRIIGRKAASAYLERLATEREVYSGDKRELDGGLARLDSVKAWNGTSEHKCDGSSIEVLYRSYKKATKRQIQEAAGAVAAGAKRQEVHGKLVDLKLTDDSESTLVLTTNAFRSPADGSIPFRTLNVTKGRVLAVAVDEALALTDMEMELLLREEAELDAEEQAANMAPQPTQEQPAPVVSQAEPAGIPAAPPNPAPGDTRLKRPLLPAASELLEPGAPAGQEPVAVISAEMRKLISELIRDELRALVVEQAAKPEELKP